MILETSQNKYVKCYLSCFSSYKIPHKPKKEKKKKREREKRMKMVLDNVIL